ncbi:hypothetical protein GGE07_003865 [Sinorhizobium terangae]|uniref:DUF2380 domain-containing protein n=1 Tax=Sinorhizobium terangae TaxID=110322 RepID=A0A6N7LHC5_SINTE|nr:DUF3280 domain-containing protein [Sinorhizobium terangae]MBB4187201.1 hypothetical protein [Sinorhizobium terangae]MQX16598.1 DUF2380 domain-containing protein [Sinorhizobium terangae]
MQRILTALILALLPTLAVAGLDKPLMSGAQVAFLGVTFIDLSTEGAYNGVRADETARLELLEGAARDRFAAEGFVILSNDPVATDLANTVNPANCNGCDVRMAAQLGADYVLVGEVRKISNLILSISLVLRDVRSGEMLRGLAVDIRSNTDDSWLRGLHYILKNHCFKT